MGAGKAPPRMKGKGSVSEAEPPTARKWRGLTRGPGPEHVFLILALVFGVAAVCVTPPLQVDDEPGHFYKAFHVSEGGLAPSRREAQMPRTLSALSDWAWGRFPLDPAKKIDVEELRGVAGMPLAPEDRIPIAYPQIRYPFTIYAPQALGILIGRGMGLPALGLMYLGRLLNLLAWTAMVFAAIRMLPFGKWTLLLLALTPMSLRQAASLSGDAVTNAAAFLLIAYALRCAAVRNERLGWRETFAAAALTALVMLTKQIYFFVPLAFLVVPPARFASRTAYLKSAGTVFAAACFALGLSVYLGRAEYFSYLDTAGIGSDSGEQLRFVLGHPVAYCGVLLRTFYEQVLREPLLVESFVGYTDWKRFYLMPEWLQTAYLPVIATVAIGESYPSWRPRLGQRAILLVVFALSWALTLTAFFLLTSGDNKRVVMGIVGRNLIPFMPLLFLAVSNMRKRPIKGHRPLSAAAAAFAFVALSAFTVVSVRSTFHPEANVLPNGGFETWIQAPERPAGFDWQASSEASWSLASGLGPENNKAVVQRWHANNAGASPILQFGTMVYDLEPYSRYRVYLRAKNMTDEPFALVACELREQEDGYLVPTLFQRAVVIPPLGRWAACAGTFYTRGLTTIRLYVEPPRDIARLPAEIVLDDWHLSEVPFGVSWRRLWLRATEHAVPE